MKKPTLTLPSKKKGVRFGPEEAIKSPTEAQPPQEQPYGDLLYSIIAEELQRAEYDKANTLTAVMERIVADEALFRQLAFAAVRRMCRKRIKNLNRARTLTAQGNPTHEPNP